LSKKLLLVLLLGALVVAGVFVGIGQARKYMESVRSRIVFRLESLEPTPRLEFPPERSRLDVAAILFVENPTTWDLDIRSFEGALELEQDGTRYSMGAVRFGQPLFVAGGGSGRATIKLSLGYREISSAWKPVVGLALGTGSDTAWTVDGTAQVRVRTVFGRLNASVPCRLSKNFPGQGGLGGKPALPKAGIGGLAQGIFGTVRNALEPSNAPAPDFALGLAALDKKIRAAEAAYASLAKTGRQSEAGRAKEEIALLKAQFHSLVAEAQGGAGASDPAEEATDTD
jgi:hypothetical protein